MRKYIFCPFLVAMRSEEAVSGRLCILQCVCKESP